MSADSSVRADEVGGRMPRLDPAHGPVAPEPRHLPARVPTGQRLRLGDGLGFALAPLELRERLRVADGAAGCHAVLEARTPQLCDLVQQTAPPHALDAGVEPGHQFVARYGDADQRGRL